MPIRINTPNTKPQPLTGKIGYNAPTKVGIPGTPLGMPLGVPSPAYVGHQRPKAELPPLEMPGSNSPRAINYYADYGGCGFWRMLWPENLLNSYHKATVSGLTAMVLEPRFYEGVKAIRLQRQATPVQLQFVKFLKTLSKQHGFKLIYEIDDVIFPEDIPDYNRCKTAFEDPSIPASAKEIMSMVDEISVTCDYMKEYYKAKTGNPNVTVIPNYPPKFWMDRYYDAADVMQRYDTLKGKPRIGYCGSGTHIDITNRAGQQDDFAHVIQNIIKTRHKYQWVFFGCHPLPLKPYIDRGEIEFHQWVPLYDYPGKIESMNLNAVIAPLVDNTFNRCKSEIKYLEAATQGIPAVCQDLCTYQNAPLRFNTGDEMINQLDHIFSDESTYSEYSIKARAYAETMWLETPSNLDKYTELYFTPYGSPQRLNLKKVNT